MKYLGIDYGAKHVGVAISDSEGRVAMPLVIFPNNKETVKNIVRTIHDHNIGQIIIGESKNLDGSDNSIQKEIKQFLELLAAEVSMPITSLNEMFTSRQAKWGIEHNMRDNPRNAKNNTRGGKIEPRIDDKAASILLQSYLDGPQ